MSTTYPTSKLSVTGPVNGQPNDATPVANGFDTVEALEDTVGYTADSRSASGSHTAQLAELFGRLQVGTATPGTPAANDLWLDTGGTPSVWRVYGGTAWAPLTGGLMTPHHNVGTAGTNATLVSATARQLGYVTAYNLAGSPAYLKIYDKATAPTIGTDVPKLTLLIPGNSGSVGAGNNLPLPNPVAFTLGLGYGLTSGIADTDTGAVAANTVTVNLGWST